MYPYLSLLYDCMIIKIIHYYHNYSVTTTITIINTLLLASNCNITYNEEDILLASAVVFHLHKV